VLINEINGMILIRLVVVMTICF